MERTTDRVSARARAVPPSLIRRMFDMTPRVPGAISLAVGEPGFPTPPHIVEAACQALHDGFTKYSPNEGYLDLREAIAEKIERVNGYRVDPASEVFVTVGAMEALLLTFMVGIDPGDEVLITDPSYTNFEGQITLAGGRPVFVPTDPERGYLPHAEDVAAAVTPAHAGHPGQQPVEPDGRRLPARPPARHRGDLRPARPAPRLRRDVRRADVRGHPEREPGVVPRAPRPHGVGALLLEGVRDDGLAHRLPHRPRVHAARDGGRPGADGLVRERRDAARRPRGRPRPPGLRRDDAAGVPAAPGPGRRAARPDPRSALPDAGRRLLRLPGRPGGDPRHARPGRAAPVRPPGGGLAGRGVRPAVGGLPAALLRLLGRGPGRGPRAARVRALPPPGEADAAGGMPERAAGAGAPYSRRVARRARARPPHLRQGQRAQPAEPRRHRARTRRGGGRGSARRRS